MNYLNKVCPKTVASYLAEKFSTLNENFVYGGTKQQQMIAKVKDNLIKQSFNLFKPFPQIDGPLQLIKVC